MSKQRGFTLMEVLIGTAILAIMMTLLSGAVFGIARGARAGEIRLDAADDLRLVRSLLRSQLGGAVPLTERDGDKQHVLFRGRYDSIRFVGHLSAHRGSGGLQLLELRVETRAGVPELMLYFRHLLPDMSFDTRIDAGWDRRTLASNLRPRFRFYGATEDGVSPGWRDTWSELDRLPELIELDVAEHNDNEWPPLVAHVRTRSAVAQLHLFRSADQREDP